MQLKHHFYTSESEYLKETWTHKFPHGDVIPTFDNESMNNFDFPWVPNDNYNQSPKVKHLTFYIL